MHKEYYYIDFRDLDIYGWSETEFINDGQAPSDFDKANHETGNKFATYQDARNALIKILEKNQIA